MNKNCSEKVELVISLFVFVFFVNVESKKKKENIPVSDCSAVLLITSAHASSR